jgi:branched-chain amino acid transport system substrate-binding protein
MVANELKTLDREAIARRIRGGAFRNTVFGDVSFAPNGQMLSRAYLFKVQDGRIAVQP